MSQVIGRTRLAYARPWHHVSLAADPRPLGRLASSIALTLMGKHKPTYSPSTDCGDYVVATGCAQLHVTGDKMRQKKYYTHTTRPGSLKEMSMERLMAKWGGGEILRRAVRGMLPKNRLRDKRLARLKTFEGGKHPYVRNLLNWETEGAEEGVIQQLERTRERRAAMRDEKEARVAAKDAARKEAAAAAAAASETKA